MKLTFLQSNKPNWGNLQINLSDAIIHFLKCGKNFEIEFSEVKEKRNLAQNAGYWRICSLLAPYMQEQYGEIVDKEEVSNTAKLAIGYSVKIGKQVTPRSLTKATKEQMNLLIEKLYGMCEFFNLKNYELTSAEMQALVEYYNKK
jgi:hypothetical protein